MKFKISIVPMGAVRTTQKQKYVDHRAKRYAVYKQLIAQQVKRHAQCYEPTTAICEVNMRFIMPIPQSWSKKKKAEMAGKPHGSKPDSDNLIKGLFDAVNGLIWVDDAQVFGGSWSKVYESEGCLPGIEMEVIELF